MPAENITEAKTMTNEPRRRRYQDDVLQLGPRKKAYVVIIHPTRCSIRIYLGGQLHLRPTDWTWPPFWPHGPCLMQHPGIVDERRPTSWRTGE